MPAERQVPREPRQYTAAEQAKALAVVLREEFGVAFRFYDAADGRPVACGDEPPPPPAPAERILAVAAGARAEVMASAGDVYRLMLPLSHSGRPVLVAAGELPALAGGPGAEQERARLEKWARSVAERLRLRDHLFAHADGTPDPAAAVVPAESATPAWEALLTLDRLIRRARINKDMDHVGRRILERAFALLPARTLVWVPSQPDAVPVMYGEACLALADCRQLAAALAQSAAAESPEPIFCNDMKKTWGERFPGVANLLALPVADRIPTGWVLALNKKPRDQTPAPAGPCPFRRSDAALLTPFVALLELHARSSRRYQELKELLVGLTRSLTAALDAKDSYTFGHSERVARIGVELGRELGLTADDLSDIYLAGLLHDVGKIGIRDAVLNKPGPLTREEYEHIKQHVTIGYNILAPLHPLRSLLPGVRWHHERWDGGGYPDGLAGEAIPLPARLLAVADAYDAMSAARPYREAMPLRRVEQVLAEGAGVQWDARVVAAFQRCRQRVHAIRQRGVGESLCAALDGALRSSVPADLLSDGLPRPLTPG